MAQARHGRNQRQPLLRHVLLHGAEIAVQKEGFLALANPPGRPDDGILVRRDVERDSSEHLSASSVRHADLAKHIRWPKPLGALDPSVVRRPAEISKDAEHQRRVLGEVADNDVYRLRRFEAARGRTREVAHVSRDGLRVISAIRVEADGTAPLEQLDAR
eukprot:5853608-Prymnesium_polylepis.3